MSRWCSKILKSSLEERFGLLMSPMKFFQHLSRAAWSTSCSDKRADACDDSQHAVVAGRLERSQDDALFVG